MKTWPMSVTLSATMRFALAGLSFLLLGGPLHAGDGPQQVVFANDFHESTSLAGWDGIGGTGAALAAATDGTSALVVTLPAANGAGSRMVSRALPIDRVRDTMLDLRCRVKADGVATPPQPWSGIKFMLVVESPSGKDYPARSNLWGTFGWQGVHFRAVIPPDATRVTLVLGLERTSGQVAFDDVSVTIHARPWAGRPAAAIGHAYTGHPGLPRLRGAMVSQDADAANLHVLGGDWHANLIRWQLSWNLPAGDAVRHDPAAYAAWLESALKRLDAALPAARREGLRVVVDLHSPPGSEWLMPDQTWPLFQRASDQARFLALWDRLARRYKGNKTVWGYDLANEPIEGDVSPGLEDWHGLATVAARRVRAIDPDHAIIVEALAGQPFSSLRYFPPLPVPGVVYSIHLYEPAAFTMQGLSGRPVGVAYPGPINGAQWDKAQMRKTLQPAIDYQNRYHVGIYVGEFSAIRWAPGAVDWLRDAISIFESNGWDWSYHAFREWEGWSVEYGSDKDATAPSPTPTDREKMLKSWYAKNVKPAP